MAPASVAERLWRHHRRVESGCWEWTGSRMRLGYGVLKIDGRVRYAHRVAFELLVAPIPRDLEIDHLCRNRGCVNPAHLDPVTHAENMRRAFALQTHCKRGHEFTPENTDLYRGRRNCLACRRVHYAARRRRSQ